MSMSYLKESVKTSRFAPAAWKLYGLYEALLLLWYRFASPFNRTAIHRYLASTSAPKLQIGAGLYPIDGWLNTDLIPRRRDVLHMDARKRYPFPQNTFDFIFAEHIIEHVAYHDGKRMLAECFRVLKPGGVPRIATPNLQFLIDLYTPNKTPLQEQYILWSSRKFSLPCEEDADTFVINNFFRNWGHRFIYDWKTLITSLQASGFVNVSMCQVGTSEHTALIGLESHGKMLGEDFNKLETMVAEAQKPAG